MLTASNFYAEIRLDTEQFLSLSLSLLFSKIVANKIEFLVKQNATFALILLLAVIS